MKFDTPIRVVCFGGGTGMPSLLSGLKQNPLLDITAIVDMFDSGGSSGLLRDQYGILPPGDILRCLLALSEDEIYARKLLLKRIRNHHEPGHTGGNLLLYAFEKVYGNYLEAIDALAQMLSVKGRVIPVTLLPSTLCAQYTDGSISKKETDVDQGLFGGKEITELYLEPVVDASQEAIDAIEQADVICVGPGSLYSSVLSNFLPIGICDALSRSCASIIYISNLLTEGVHMKERGAEHLIEIVEKMIGKKLSAALVNTTLPKMAVLDRYAQEQKFPIIFSKQEQSDPRIVAADLWIDSSIARHDSMRLASIVTFVISKLLNK